MKANIDTFERLARVALGLTLLALAIVAFEQVLAKFFFGGLGAYFLFEAATGICPLYARLGATKPTQRLSADKLYLTALLSMQLVLAYLWFHAGYGKVMGSFVGDLPKTLAFFASKNPHPWFASFLTDVAVPNAAAFGVAVMYGQLLIGIGLAVAAGLIVYGDKQWRKTALIVSAAALIAGACMNWHFWLASAWTSPGSATSNVAMFWPQMILAYVWIVRAMEEKG